MEEAIRNSLTKLNSKAFTLTVSRMDWDDSHGQTENSTKANGKMVLSTDQECGKEQKVTTTLEIGNLVKLTGMEFITGLTVISIRANFWIQ
jgi:hypothetical protein